MPKDKLDKETQDIMKQSQQIADFVHSDDWKVVKATLFSELGKVNSLTNIPMILKGQELTNEVEVRRLAVQMIMQWISDVEGTADNNENLKRSLLETEKDVIISQFD